MVPIETYVHCCVELCFSARVPRCQVTHVTARSFEGYREMRGDKQISQAQASPCLDDPHPYCTVPM